MISAFVSRDSGFGMPISHQQLVEINSFRQGTEYKDKVAATQIVSTAAKQPLTELPFVRSLLIGATEGGYWNSFPAHGGSVGRCHRLFEDSTTRV